MDISIDIETLGLRATKDSFIMGCLWIENRKKHEVYYSPKKLWKRVLELAKQCEKEKRTLTVWSHNAQYDTAGYVNLKDRQLRFLSNKPFIWNYINGEGKEIIRFLDTMNIFPKMSLKKVGEIIGIPKLDYDVLKIKRNMTEEELAEMEKYCANDTLIVLKAIRYIKDKLKEEDIEMRRIITINQIARNYLWHKWLKLEDEYLEPYFWNKKKGETRRTFRKDEIHSAYRGGRCEAFQYGKIKEAKEADCNSLYPYALTQIKTPNLKTERKRIYTEKQCNERAHEYINKDMDKIGVARVMLKNDKCELGLLQTRTDDGNYYPRIGQTIIGTYTNIEIKKALEEGYLLMDVEWSILYDEAINPFKEIIPEIYKKRQTPSPFDSWFYKMMMNAGIGKMAQHRTEQDIKIKSIEKAKEMLNEGYEIIGSEDEEDYFYRKIDVKAKAKPYYLPIIPTLVNAWSRIYMYDALKGAKGLIYTDTDSVIAKELPKDIKYGYDLGKFKMIRKNEEMYIYGRKTYKIGNEIRLSGIGKSMLKTEEFDKGEINYKKQITIATTNNLKLVGEFKEEKRNLNLQTINEQNKKEELKSKELIIDSDIKDINKFMETLIKTM